ncbi:MAG: fatty acid desaturase [Opitutaceae bacterium]|nr:fatty acid desaturase [Opitutaceae bacterium]|tara:strand:+ start:86 stop:1192 length:1107 start_codon:yes stop_codon:yes gene_type:complete
MRIKHWDNFGFIAGYHLLLLILLPAFVKHFHWSALVLCGVTFMLGGISITAGYHRLFSHRSYKASPIFESLNLFFATLAVEASALQWSNDHRLHHNHVDTDNDPYNIHRGFFYAHIGWLFTHDMPIIDSNVSDLKKNPRVMFQYNHLLSLSLLSNGLVFAIGCLFMHPIAALFGGLLLRVFLLHHCTWFVNSLAHMWGSRTYAKEQSAVDNGILAFLTLGEGYHNYHHAMATDYRNGVRWFHFDPTKWFLWTCSKVGLVSDLRRVHKVRLQKILVRKDKDLLLERFKSELDEKAVELQKRAEELAHTFEEKASIILAKIRELQKSTAAKRKELKVEIRELRKELQIHWKDWIELTQYAVSNYSITHAH